jgi:hypothetical protein
VAGFWRPPQRSPETLALVEAQPLSELDFARLKARGRQSALGRVAAEWRRPSESWQQTMRWTALALADEWRRWQTVLPDLLRGDFLFTLALWVGVFTVATAVVAMPAIPLPARYGAGLAALAYLYIYADLTRRPRALPAYRYVLGGADVAVVLAIGALSMPYVGYARVLMFLAALRVAARFPDIRSVAAGFVILLPFELAGHAALLTALLDGFAVLCTMLLVIHLSAMTATAEATTKRQAALAQLTTSLARVRDEDALFAQLVSHVGGLIPGCAWAFWLRQAGATDFRAVRWTGVPEGEMPVFSFSPTLGGDPNDPVIIRGPLPGTSHGEQTVVQATTNDTEVNGLITVSGAAAGFDAATQRLLRQLADDIGGTLSRIEALDDQRQRAEAMEQANRLAGLAAPYASSASAALAAIRSAVAEVLRSESLHLEWVDGDNLVLVAPIGDALDGHAPVELPLAGTRTAEVLLQGRPIREPITGRRPEDLFMVPAGLRQLAIAPMECAGMRGTVQLGRRLPRPFSNHELLVLELLADRLGLLLAAGVATGIPISHGGGR